MERTELLITVALVVAASGCIQTSDQTESESPKAIQVQELAVSPTQVYKGSSVSAELRFKNVGRLPADIRLGKGGTNVLRNYCRDIFTMPGLDGASGADPSSVEGFEATGPGEADRSSYRLPPGATVSLQWTLEEDYAFEIPRPGLRCNMKFEVPFNYSVQAFRQVQIKRDRSVEGSVPESKSSAGPMKLQIATQGGTDTANPSSFIAGEDDSMRVLIQLVNQGQEDFKKGVINVQESSLRIEAKGPLEFESELTQDCSEYEDYRAQAWCLYSQQSGDERLEGCNIDENSELRMSEGESRIITCDVKVPEPGDLESPAMMADITASVNYTYRKDAGTRNVEVKRTAGG